MSDTTLTVSGRRKTSGQKGFTLVELMVAVVIVAVLMAIALPSYREHVRSARRADAQSVLMQAAQYMERFYSENTSYSRDAGGGSVSLPSNLTQVPTDSTPTFYNIALESVSDSSYVLRATPTNDQTGDGYLEYTSAGVKWWDRYGEGRVNCWSRSC